MSTADFRVRGNVVAQGVGISYYSGSINAALGFVGNLTGSATSLTTPRTVSLTGDATASGSFDGSANLSLAAVLANSGVSAGSYGSSTQVVQFTANVKGLVTAASNVAIAFPVTTVAGRTGAIALTQADVSGTVASSTLGAANGVATLDSGGKVPTNQLPASVLGGLNFQGTWNASTNTPTLVSNVGTKGFYYVVATAGNTTINGNTNWTVGDQISFNGTTWDQIQGGSADVSSVFGRVGAIVMNSADVTTALGFTPYNATNPSNYISGNQSITFSGDATGTGTTAVSLTLANSGITAGTYSKITFNAKGIATGFSALLASDIPSLDWTKITTGKPTTLTGYGIVMTSGDVTTALGFTPITAAGAPVQSVAGRTGAVVLTSTDVGLSNVTNVSQVNKAGDTMTGALSAPGLTSTSGVNLGSTVIQKDLTPATSSTAGTKTLDSFSTSTFRSAKYTVQISQGTNFEALELLVVHDGTNSPVVEYARVTAGSDTAVTFDAVIAAGTLTLSYVQPAISTTVKAYRSSLAI